MLEGFVSQQETTETVLARACVTLDFFVKLKIVLKLSMNSNGRICPYTYVIFKEVTMNCCNAI